MNKINNMRAKLIFEKFHENQNTSGDGITFVDLVNKLLTVPSFYETECCTGSVQNFPIVYLNNDVLHDSLSNIQEAIQKKLR